MKDLIRVFPRRTSHTPSDRLAFVGEPPLFKPSSENVSEVHISVTFTRDLKHAETLRRSWLRYYDVVKVGGPATGAPSGFNGFVPGRYIKTGVTFTTRGCDRKCPWCLVPQREGKLVEIPGYPDGWIIQDNNFLQATQEHQASVFEMLRRIHRDKRPDFMATRGVEFAGGLDARLVTPWFAEQLKTIRLNQLFLAADTAPSIKHLEKAREILKDQSQKKMRVYVLIGFGNDTIEKATDRLQRVWNLDCMPHSQLYQPVDRWIDYSKAWRQLNRTWSRPAAMYAANKAS